MSTKRKINPLHERTRKSSATGAERSEGAKRWAIAKLRSVAARTPYHEASDLLEKFAALLERDATEEEVDKMLEEWGRKPDGPDSFEGPGSESE